MIKLQAREYRLENLEKIENYQYGISFDAVFKQGNRITISDANVSAMRALNETLQDKLLSGRYKEWDTLLAEGYKTKDDNVLRALTAPLKRNYCDMINREEMLAEPGWDISITHCGKSLSPISRFLICGTWRMRSAVMRMMC